MEERNVIRLKKEEFDLREYVKNSLGKGKVSRVKIEYTPVGEKIVITTSKPGLVIGRGGENIEHLTKTVKGKFGLENPRIEIEEIKDPSLDAQLVADEIAMGLEGSGPLKFKVIAYRTLQKIMRAGALGSEIRIHGKVPSSRAKQWRFSQGYLKKTGESANVVDRAKSRAETKPGTVGIRVSILRPEAKLKDKITINDEMIQKLKEGATLSDIKEESKSKKKSTKKTSKKVKKE